MTTTMTETVTADTPRPPHVDRPLVFAFAAGAWCFAVGLAVQACVERPRLSSRPPPRRRRRGHRAARLAPARRSRARALLGLRGPVVAWRAFAAGAIAFGVYDHTVDYAPRSSWSFFAYFNRWELEPEVFIVPVTVLIAAVVLAKRTVVSRARLRFEALVGVGLALAMLSAGIARARRSPEVDGYVPSLTRLGAVPSEPTMPRWEASRSEEPSSDYTDHRFGAVTVRRFVFRHRGQCALLVARDGMELPNTLAPRGEALTSCESRDVRLDARRGLVVLSYETMWGLGGVNGYTRDSVDALQGARASMGHWRDAFTIPRNWLWTSALLFMIALGWIAHSIASQRSLRDRTGWRQATLRADGMIELDGAQFPVPYGAMQVPGPVVLLRVPTTQDGSPFRGGGATLERDVIIMGTLSDLIGTLESDVEASLAYSITASLFSAAPLVAGAIEGLL
ncbi:MAG: hypothetical protein U0326_22690 [Polyangiales bacterium]